MVFLILIFTAALLIGIAVHYLLYTSNQLHDKLKSFVIAGITFSLCIILECWNFNFLSIKHENFLMDVWTLTTLAYVFNWIGAALVYIYFDGKEFLEFVISQIQKKRNSGTLKKLTFFMAFPIENFAYAFCALLAILVVATLLAKLYSVITDSSYEQEIIKRIKIQHDVEVRDIKEKFKHRIKMSDISILKLFETLPNYRTLKQPFVPKAINGTLIGKFTWGATVNNINHHKFDISRSIIEELQKSNHYHGNEVFIFSCQTEFLAIWIKNGDITCGYLSDVVFN